MNGPSPFASRWRDACSQDLALAVWGGSAPESIATIQDNLSSKVGVWPFLVERRSQCEHGVYESCTERVRIWRAGRSTRIEKPQLSSEGRQIRQKGRLKKAVGILFEMVGTVSATPDGKIRIHPTQMKVEHLPVKGY